MTAIASSIGSCIVDYADI